MVARCRCDRPIPLSIALTVWAVLQEMASDTVIATYYCRRCGVNAVTLGSVVPDTHDRAA